MNLINFENIDTYQCYQLFNGMPFEEWNAFCQQQIDILQQYINEIGMMDDDTELSKRFRTFTIQLQLWQELQNLPSLLDKRINELAKKDSVNAA